MSREEIIKKVKHVFTSNSSAVRGVIINSYESQEVGIRTYNYDILTEDGFYSGYWTEEAPQLTDPELISSIIKNEDCEYWEDMEDVDLHERLQTLLSFKSK